MTQPKVTVDNLLRPSMREHVRYIGTVLFCHLLVEQLLYELLAGSNAQRGFPVAPLEKITFAKLVDRCERETIRTADGTRTIITPNLADALRALNALRVSMAHTIEFVPSYEAVHEVVRSLGAAGVEFTDGMDASPGTAREYGYDELGMLEEATKHLMFDLEHTLAETGIRK